MAAEKQYLFPGKVGVNAGIHAWEFTWEGPLGTVACIGLATKYVSFSLSLVFWK